MAIRLKAIKLKMPGETAGSNDKYIGRAVSSGEVGLRELSKRIEKMSTMSGADIRGVLFALIDVTADWLSEGKIVRLGELGSFRISVNSQIEDSEDKVNGKSIKNAKIIFTLGEEFKDMIKALEYKMV